MTVDDDFQEHLKATAAKIDKARAAHATAGVAGVAASLAASKPVSPVAPAETAPGEASPAEIAEAAAKAAEKKGTSTKAPVSPRRGKGVVRVVDEILKAQKFVTDKVGNVYQYSDKTGAWSQVTDYQLLSIALNYDQRSSGNKRAEVVKRLKAATMVHDLQWGRVADTEIACANGIVDVVTLKIRPHEPDNMLDRTLPIAFDPKAQCPLWVGALELWFPAADDKGRSAALQEFFGYTCLSHAKYKKALVLKGESNTGKSVPAMVAKAMVGHENATTLPVEHMDDPVKVAVLKGKALNVMTELSADSMIADGGFKTLVSTEEPVLVEKKYTDPIMYVPTAKHVIVTNNLPKLNDHTSATFNRLLIVPFDVVLPEEKQDRELLDKIKADELPGILLWAMAGAARLIARKGQWPDVEAARQIMSTYRDDMNPIRQFLAERTRPEKGLLVPLYELTKSFNAWNMGSRNYGIKGVGKLLRAAGWEDRIRVAKYEGSAITCVEGVRLVHSLQVDLEAGESTGFVDEATGAVLVEAVVKGHKPGKQDLSDVGEDADGRPP